MTAALKVVDEAAIERLVSQVRGVMAVRVVLDAQGQIDELHVVGSPGRSAKQMVRDVESIVYVQGGVRIDHRKISLVQIAESIIHPALVRIQLLGIERADDEQGSSIGVTLGMGDQQVKGLGRSRPEKNDQPVYLAGYATINALNQLIEPRGQLRLEDLQRQSFGEFDVCLSHLSLLNDESMTTLLGISIVRGDEVTVAARAVLDAVNRTIQRLVG
jgi:hypothetical protein